MMGFVTSVGVAHPLSFLLVHTGMCYPRNENAIYCNGEVPQISPMALTFSSGCSKFKNHQQWTYLFFMDSVVITIAFFNWRHFQGTEVY